MGIRRVQPTPFRSALPGRLHRSAADRAQDGRGGHACRGVVAAAYVRPGGVRPRHAHLDGAEPGGRSRLPELRLARPRRPPFLHRVLRERRQGHRLGSRSRTAHAGVLPPNTPSTSWPSESDYWHRPTGPPHRAHGAAITAAATTNRSPGTTLFGLIADELNALTRPMRRSSTPPAAPRNEAAFLYQLFVAPVRHQQPAGLLQHVPRVVAAWPCRRSVGIGKGTVTLEDFDQGRTHPHPRPEPGHEPPANAHGAPEPRSSTARRSLPSIPCRKPGCSGSRNPQESARLVGPGHAAGRPYLQVRINGDLALLKGTSESAPGPRRKEPRNNRPRLHRRENRWV